MITKKGISKEKYSNKALLLLAAYYFVSADASKQTLFWRSI